MNNTEAIRKRPVSEYCIQAIERYIYAHNLRPGDRLPSLHDMCRLFGVSLTSLREAVKTLELCGEIEIRNGAGVFIRSRDGAFQSPLEDAPFYTKRFKSRSDLKRAFIDMLEVRKMLENQMIECIIRNATDEELLNARNYLDRLMFHYYNALPTTEDDQVFHRKFYKLCHNSILLDLAENAAGMYAWMWDAEDHKNDFLFLDTIKMHEDMFNYVCGRDVKNAKRVNDETLNLVFSRLIKV